MKHITERWTCDICKRDCEPVKEPITIKVSPMTPAELDITVKLRIPYGPRDPDICIDCCNAAIRKAWGLEAGKWDAV